jgi:hypothetical protein
MLVELCFLFFVYYLSSTPLPARFEERAPRSLLCF